MTEKSASSASKQLTIQYRLEAGCLGPSGQDYVEDFCFFAYAKLEEVSNEHVRWEIIPRYDKTLPEFEYTLGKKKKLSRDQAARYLEMLNHNLDKLEGMFEDILSVLIDEFIAKIG